jgi:Flp pilus assembly protein TadD
MSKRKRRSTNKTHKTNKPVDKPTDKGAGSHAQGLFAQALDLHRKGDLSAAKALYTQVLSTEPQHADALHLLGVLVSQERDFVRATELIGQAIQLQPHNAAFHCNLGTVLLDNQQVDAALASLDLAIALQPDFAQAHYNKGNALRILNPAGGSGCQLWPRHCLQTRLHPGTFQPGKCAGAVAAMGASGRKLPARPGRPPE